MEWGAAVTAIITLIVALFKWWQSRQPQRDQENQDDAIQQGRKDITEGNSAAVSDRIDKLLSGPDNSSGQSSGEITAERIGSVVGVVDPAGSSSSNTGKSGILQ